MRRMYASHDSKGFRGLFDGITGTWLRQMSYSVCRFWAYDESKKILGAGKDAPAWRLVAAGGMGKPIRPLLVTHILTTLSWRYRWARWESRRSARFS